MHTDTAHEDWGRVAYGLDVQGDLAVVVRAERSGSAVAVSPERVDLARVAEDSRRGMVLAASLGPRECVTQWLEVAMASRAKVLKVLPTVFDIQLPFALEDCAYAFLGVARLPGGRSRALGVATRRQDLDRRLTQWASLGIDPAVVDAEGLALWAQSVAEAPGEGGDPGTVRVVAYRGADRATLAIGVAGEYRSAHAVRLEDAAQVRRLIRAAAGAPVHSLAWFWAGPGASPGTGEPLLAALREEWTCTATLHRDPATFLARALAVRALSPGAWRCNLRSGPQEHPALTRRRARHGFRGIGIMLAAGVLLCAVNAASSAFLHRAALRREQGFLDLARTLAGPSLGAAKGEHALSTVRRRVADREKALAVYVRQLAPSLTLVLRDMLEVAAAEHVTLESVAVSDARITVTGRGPAWESCRAVVAGLEARHFTTKVERGDALPDGGIPFTITAEGEDE